MTVYEIMEEAGCEGANIFSEPSYDTAFIGISHDDRAVYDYEKMIEWCIANYGLSVEEAMDLINTDTICSLSGTQRSPIIVFRRQTGGDDADY